MNPDLLQTLIGLPVAWIGLTVAIHFYRLLDEKAPDTDEVAENVRGFVA
ncbi:hypothetical protein SAMN05421858_5094 [Haladaptatus litoreus]|uniref:Uncharacterized protein n=1 Tax=Haladaptatus litoreus TaxID=553468 RepID=A0A1N7FIH6_9EURY|nr:hypothetical protein [Haladaptatus litoreus]SIS00090.1 hypothetical protein SAMN05421858_5094 [Haladaptatus litoreus]